MESVVLQLHGKLHWCDFVAILKKCRGDTVHKKPWSMRVRWVNTTSDAQRYSASAYAHATKLDI